MRDICFIPRDTDQYFFVLSDCICVSYVDGILVFAKDNLTTTKLMDGLKVIGDDLNKVNDVVNFYGVDIGRYEDGNIEMTQTGLINKMIEALDLNSCMVVIYLKT